MEQVNEAQPQSQPPSQRFYALEQLGELAGTITLISEGLQAYRAQVAGLLAGQKKAEAFELYRLLERQRTYLVEQIRATRPFLMELENPLAPAAQKLAEQLAAFPLMTADYSKLTEVLKRLADALPDHQTTDASIIGRLMNNVRLGHYGEPLHLPFGVALGGAEAEQFLLCYFHARENQEEEIRSRTQAIRALGRKVGQFHPDEETTLTVMAFRSSDPELHKQMDVAQRFFSDDITAAAGLYYLGFGSNYINEQQERQILSNPEAYALCVAELQPVEEAAR